MRDFSFNKPNVNLNVNTDQVNEIVNKVKSDRRFMYIAGGVVAIILVLIFGFLFIPKGDGYVLTANPNKSCKASWKEFQSIYDSLDPMSCQFGVAAGALGIGAASNEKEAEKMTWLTYIIADFCERKLNLKQPYYTYEGFKLKYCKKK